MRGDTYGASQTVVITRLDRVTQYAAASRLSRPSLEYWIARSSRATTAVGGAASRPWTTLGEDDDMIRASETLYCSRKNHAAIERPRVAGLSATPSCCSSHRLRGRPPP